MILFRATTQWNANATNASNGLSTTSNAAKCKFSYFTGQALPCSFEPFRRTNVLLHRKLVSGHSNQLVNHLVCNNNRLLRELIKYQRQCPMQTVHLFGSHPMYLVLQMIMKSSTNQTIEIWNLSERSHFMLFSLAFRHSNFSIELPLCCRCKTNDLFRISITILFNGEIRHLVTNASIFYFFNFCTMNLFAIQKCSGSYACRVKVIQNWIVDYANADVIFPHKTNWNGHEWNLTNEIVCSIDWINNPCWGGAERTV